MKKIKKVFFVTLAVYLTAIIVVNQWSIHVQRTELHKIKVKSCKTGDYGSWYSSRFNHEIIIENSTLGNLYYNDNYFGNLPINIEVGKKYVVYMYKYQAHTWKDFFLFGTKYDYVITLFVTSKSKSIDEIYSEEEKKTGILGYIYALLIIIGYAAISIFIDKRLNKIYASGKSKNGFIEFNKPLSLEISSVIISILGVLLCASFGLNCFYSGEYLFCCVSILVILIPLKRFLKEYKNVRCSVLLSPSIIILKGNDKEIKIDTNTIEKLDLTYKESSKGSRSITESKLFITKKDGDTITFNLCSNNLEKFSPAIKIQMNEFYADKMQN